MGRLIFILYVCYMTIGSQINLKIKKMESNMLFLKMTILLSGSSALSLPPILGTTDLQLIIVAHWQLSLPMRVGGGEEKEFRGMIQVSKFAESHFNLEFVVCIWILLFGTNSVQSSLMQSCASLPLACPQCHPILKLILDILWLLLCYWVLTLH